MKLWHPHTEQPEGVASLLIALPPDLDDGDEPPQIHVLASDYYSHEPEQGIVNEKTGDPIRFAAYFWAYESDVLRELDAQLQEVSS